MRQIAYFSTAAVPQTSQCIHEILVAARSNNRRDDITGLLVAGGNRYMQVIEGPKQELDRLYASIRRDHRHLAITTLFNRVVFKRAFGDWSMAYRPEPALGQFDSFPKTLHYLTQNVADTPLRRQIELFARAFIAAPSHATPWGEVA